MAHEKVWSIRLSQLIKPMNSKVSAPILWIFLKKINQIFIDENDNQHDSYVSKQDEYFVLNESELDDESDYDSSEEDEPLDKNGKRGTCGGFEDEEEDYDITDSEVPQKVRKMLSSLISFRRL